MVSFSLTLSLPSLSLFLATSSFSSFFTSSGFSSFVVLMLWLVLVELLQLSMLYCFYALERGLFFDCNMSLPYYTLCWPLSLITTATRRITIILIIRYLILYAYLLIHIYINIFWFCFVLLCFVFLYYIPWFILFNLSHFEHFSFNVIEFGILVLR